MSNKRLFFFSVVIGLITTLLSCASVSDSVASDESDILGSLSPATYLVTFDSTWSSSSHPTDFPSTAHFSRFVGTTHTGDVRLWESGSLATNGIKAMAELGRTSTLGGEVDVHIGNGDAYERIVGPNLATSPATVTFTITVTSNFPYVTLVTMLAPSPDWFVGTNALLLLENDAWVSSASVTLYPYDSGTDSGTTYRSSNSVTSPPVPIRRLNEAPFTADTAVGTLRFELVAEN